MRTAALLLACVVVLAAASSLSAEVELRHKWVWCMHNLATDSNVDFLIDLMDRAKKCGYTGFMLADYKFNVLNRMDKHYFDNVERLKTKARDLGLDLVPTCCGFGYSEGILAHDPNLSEGYPVVNAPFEVKAGELVPLMDPDTKLLNGDFEDLQDGCFAGWIPQDADPRVVADHDVVKRGKTSVRIEGLGKGSAKRLYQTVKTEPFRAYHLSVWIKTENVADPSAVALTATARRPANLSYLYIRVKGTQDWTQHHIAFNSLENTQVRVGCEVGATAGKVWFDDVRLEPLGFVNVLRRDACPLKVASPDGKTVYEEGKDISRIVDPKLGNEQWPGTFAAWHTPPRVTVPEGSRLKEGDRVAASYYHPMLTYDAHIACSLLDPKVYEIVDNQVKRLTALFGAKFYMMSYDEIRVGGWTPDYAGLTAGEALARSVKKSCDIIRKHAPDAKILVWNDMFDPNHNAQKKGYYLVKTPWAGSWEGLPKDVIVMDWLSGTALKSFEFFNGRGNTEQMIAGYYDGNLDAGTKMWLDAAKASKAKITGIMYTTWQAKYDDLEAFMDAVKKYEK